MFQCPNEDVKSVESVALGNIVGGNMEKLDLILISEINMATDTQYLLLHSQGGRSSRSRSSPGRASLSNL